MWTDLRRWLSFMTKILIGIAMAVRKETAKSLRQAIAVRLCGDNEYVNAT